MKNKNFIWIAVGVIVLILLLLLLSRKEVRFNTYEFGNDNYVTNHHTVKYLDTITHVALDVMGIKNVAIRLDCQEKPLDLGEDMETAAFIIVRDRQAVIFLEKNLGRYEAITIIAHELVHLQQRIEGRLITSGVLIWEGEQWDSNTPYTERPWEQEAFNREIDISKQIKEILIYDES